MTRLPRSPALPVLLLAPLLLAGAVRADPGVVCKRVNEQGVTEYKNMNRCGQGWVLAAQYRAELEAPPALAAPQASPAPGALPPAPSAPAPEAPPLTAATAGASFVDFGDPNAASVLGRLHSGRGPTLRYLQIGDSHTAGDFLTERLRQRLQAVLGDGGLGWVTPMTIPGQRMARVSFTQTGWQLASSRSSGPGYDYPFGGFIAQAGSAFAALTVTPRYQTRRQTITLLIRQGVMDAPLTVTDVGGVRLPVKSPALDGLWHTTSFDAELPITITTGISPQTAIGGFWMRNAGGGGAIVSAVGINGSELEQWNRWRDTWLQDLAPAQPDLIALAYGTNEAFRSTLDPVSFQATLAAAIDTLRQRFPDSALLIIGAPESLKGTAGQCGVRPAMLDAVQAAQLAVAQSRRTLFWDWQQAMGGRCSMVSWVARGLARRDGVHFSREGYETLADNLYTGLAQAR